MTRRIAWILCALSLAVATSACAGEVDEGKAMAKPAAKAATDMADKKAASPGATGALAALDAFIAQQSIDKSARGWKTRLPKPPAVRFAPGKQVFWLLETNHGTIKIKLMPDVAPKHVASTAYLTKLGFYDGLSFHRVIPGFMAQGGCPLGTGTGGPGYEYNGEFSPSVKHDGPGKLSMANRGPGTDGSQFFLTFTATPHLDNRHTIFGEVVEGDGTLKELEKRGSRSGRTSEPLQLRRATIEVE